MKRLAYPFVLVFFSLVSAAIFTAMMAMTLASYSKNEKGSLVVKERSVGERATASR
jgi:hypothetical protein